MNFKVFRLLSNGAEMLVASGICCEKSDVEPDEHRGLKDVCVCVRVLMNIHEGVWLVRRRTSAFCFVLRFRKKNDINTMRASCSTNSFDDSDLSRMWLDSPEDSWRGVSPGTSSGEQIDGPTATGDWRNVHSCFHLLS